MKLVLERLQIDPDVTIGSLTVDGVWLSWVLEDPVREIPGQPVSFWKIAGQTAIPFGTYGVAITRSSRFQRDLPILLNVPGFDGVRFHPGNSVVDTAGCPLPGLDRYAKSVGRSREAFAMLYSEISNSLRAGNQVTVDVVRG